MNKKYSDIINLPAPVSKRPRLSLYDRAAQFAPFAALTGFGAVINETARLTDTKPELDSETARLLNERIKIIEENIRLKPEIYIIFFLPDQRKSGGSLKKFSGKIRRVDKFNRQLIFTDKTQIPLDDVVFIQGDFFKNVASDKTIW